MSKKVKTIHDMEALLLQETAGTVIVFDLHDFSRLAATSSPLDLGAALTAYYLHAEKCILGEDGRVVKFSGDMVLGVWLERQHPTHREKAMDALAACEHEREPWLERNRKQKLPSLDYSVAIASGPLLAGQIGTPRLRTFDVLGEAVNIAAKLAAVAQARGVHHLSAVAVPGAAIMEVEGVELGGKHIRLYRLAD
jgi:class 3 adenylate cyclase